MKTLGRFVLIDNSSKKQIYLEWKTQTQLNRGMQSQPVNKMSYSRRKNMISQLKPLSQIPKYSKNSNNNTVNIRQSASTKVFTPSVNINPQRQKQCSTAGPITEFKTFYRTRSLTKISRNNKMQTNNQIFNKDRRNTQKLRQIVVQADKNDSKIIAVIKIKKDGLRNNIKHDYFKINKNMCHQNVINEIKQQLFPQFMSISAKKPYLFHLSKQPINDIIYELDKKQYVIFADMNPKYSITFQMQMSMFEQASLIQQNIKKQIFKFEQFKQQNQLQQLNKSAQILYDNENEGKFYQWQKIGNVKQYVQMLINKPEAAKNISKTPIQLDQVQQWYQEQYNTDKVEVEEHKKSGKNLYFDVQNHFPNQTAQIRTLSRAAARVNMLESIQNKHQIKQRPIQNMMQKIKRQNENASRLKQAQTQRIRSIGYKSQKFFLKQLDNKNTPLVTQNIPYIMSKYGINRSEAYNLYNLYKSLQKISAMRLFNDNQYRRVMQKGVDRKTFDQVLKGLYINPGDQVVRNICYFPQFITWQQFIKIISISMRKTPKSKLQAILQGLGSSSTGFLTVEQIDIMVGSSLQKIFGQDEPELRKYFVGVVMRQLDTDKSGTIEVQQLKAYVLNKEIEDLDIVSYLMLNS